MSFLKKYQEFVDKCPELDDFALGLPGEVGEVLELVKKDRRPGNYRQPLDMEKFDKELGDILWYVTKAANKHGRDLKDIFQKNIDKLSERHDL